MYYSDGRLTIHYCPIGVPGDGGVIEYQKWNREAMEAVNSQLPPNGTFDLVHMESQPIFLPHFKNLSIPVIPSWHGVM